MNQNPALEQSISTTLAYFDVAEFPLTLEELFTFLWLPPTITFSEFTAYLVGRQSSRWQCQGGYYFLPGRAELIARRQERIVPTEHMLKKARRAVQLVSWVPFLKAVFVCNSVGAENATLTSDIDLFIITAPKRIWLVRFFTHAILRLFGLRTYGKKISGRMCLCFFVDTEHLDLGPLRVVPGDVHFAYWLQQMFVLYDTGDVARQFRRANTWALNYVPGQQGELRFPLTYTRGNKPGLLGQSIKKILEKVWGTSYGNLIEAEAKKIQWRSIAPKIKALAREPNNHVVLAEGVLKFHERDTRRDYHAAWLKKNEYVAR